MKLWKLSFNYAGKKTNQIISGVGFDLVIFRQDKALFFGLVLFTDEELVIDHPLDRDFNLTD